MSGYGGWVLLKVGQRPAALLGLVLNALGAGGLLILGHLTANIPEVGLAAVTFLEGAGMGFATLSFILGVQASVGAAGRGDGDPASQSAGH